MFYLFFWLCQLNNNPARSLSDIHHYTIPCSSRIQQTECHTLAHLYAPQCMAQNPAPMAPMKQYMQSYYSKLNFYFPRLGNLFILMQYLCFRTTSVRYYQSLRMSILNLIWRCGSSPLCKVCWSMSLGPHMIPVKVSYIHTCISVCSTASTYYLIHNSYNTKRQ